MLGMAQTQASLSFQEQSFAEVLDGFHATVAYPLQQALSAAPSTEPVLSLSKGSGQGFASGEHAHRSSREQSETGPFVPRAERDGAVRPASRARRGRSSRRLKVPSVLLGVSRSERGARRQSDFELCAFFSLGAQECAFHFGKNDLALTKIARRDYSMRKDGFLLFVFFGHNAGSCLLDPAEGPGQGGTTGDDR